MSSQPSAYGSTDFMFDQQANFYSSMPGHNGLQTPKREQGELSHSPFESQDDAIPGNLNLSQLGQYQEAEDSSKYVSCTNSPSPSPSFQGGLASVDSCSSESSNSQQHLDFMHSTNSLGLMGSMNPPSPSIKSFGLSREAMLRPAMLQRQISSSNLSDTSGSSYFNDGASVGSQSQVDPTSPIRSSFTPAQSPLGLTHSISSLSGLAIGNSHPFDLSREMGQRYPTFQGRNHDELLSLSGSVQMMNAPLSGQQPKRRSTCGAHTLYSSEIQQIRDERLNEDKTPMPPSAQTFPGHTSSSVSSMSQQHQHQTQQQQHPSMPLTPNHRPMGHMENDFNRNGIPVSFSAPRLRHPDTITSPMGETVFSQPGGGYAFQGRSLEHAIAEQESKYADQFGDMEHNQLMQGHMPSGLTKHPSLGHLSSSAMSRVSSAPSAPQMNMGGGDFSGPMTPSRTSSFLQQMQQQTQFQQQQQQQQMMMMQQQHRFPATPLTPQSTSYNGYDMSFSAPQMMSSRSMINMSSPFASGLSLDHDTPETDDGDSGEIQSPSSGVSRTLTPRSRGRGNLPPPLIVSSADKLHICFCGKRFKRLEHLKRHNRVHTQERPHQCPAPGCNKWFGRTDNLTQHLKTHYRTLGRSSENLLNITNAKASTLGSQSAEPRHDPHAAAQAAAAQAVSKTNMKSRRSTVSNDVLGGPIALNRPESTSPLMNTHLTATNNENSQPRQQLSASPM